MEFVFVICPILLTTLRFSLDSLMVKLNNSENDMQSAISWAKKTGDKIGNGLEKGLLDLVMGGNPAPGMLLNIFRDEFLKKIPNPRPRLKVFSRYKLVHSAQRARWEPNLRYNAQRLYPEPWNTMEV